MRILCAAERDIFGIRARGTHSNEREGALRIDSDAVGTVELGGAGAILQTLDASAGERGDRLGFEIDLPNAVIVSVLTSRNGAQRARLGRSKPEWRCGHHPIEEGCERERVCV